MSTFSEVSDERKSEYNLENLREMKRRLGIEFESCSMDKVIFCLNFCDDINISVFTYGDLQHILKLTNSLKEKIM